MTSKPDDEFLTIRDQNGSRRGRTSNGDIDLPIANWAVSVVAVSRFFPFSASTSTAMTAPTVSRTASATTFPSKGRW